MNNFKKYIFEMLEDEYWYGPIVNDGVKYPLNNKSVQIKLTPYCFLIRVDTYGVIVDLN
ncbi:hypothetical protein [Clostridium perfringens]|uniref:hypothetical protein n=1 Tax=Clostridium perfringens TaxID=1502 RepID=UPI00322219A4